MSETLRRLDGSATQIGRDELDGLASALDGTLLTRDSDGYDDARAIWNAMIDRRPGAIIRCRSGRDVERALRFARNADLLIAVRGGGHNIAGNAVCDGGLMIDLSLMKAIQVDASQRTARVEPGCTLAELDAATQAVALAVPLGINSTTGVAGLTLGGGFGWLSRKYGATVDSLRSATVVTVDGETLVASESDHADLFWGIRGGGANLGVVTSFELDLHPAGPEVLSGLIVHPLGDAPEILRSYRDLVAQLPNDTAVWAVMRKAPPLPFLPQDWHGREVLVLAAFHAGDMAEGERILKPIRDLGNPIADVIGPHPYTGWQQAFDPLLTPGARNYWKSNDFLALEDDLLDVAVARARELPSPACEIFFAQVGGAVKRVPADATAYPHRDTEFIMNVHARWTDAGDDDACIAWARDVARDTAPFATGGVYVNFMPEDEADRVGAAYGANLSRLRVLKERYDPLNRLRLNQNVPPGGADARAPLPPMA